MVKRIGVDAGGSLVKIAYVEDEQIHIKTFSTKEMNEVSNWLRIISPDAILAITGGKSGSLQHVVKQKSEHMDEFQAVVEGTRYLLKHEKAIEEDSFILVSIGTGTSIFLVSKDTHERLLGSGIGGGTLMGLGTLISDRGNFHELIEMAAKGNHENSDLLVKDIYAPNEPPLGGDLTASNFGKVHVGNKASVADYMASLVQLIGETIILLASQAAIGNQVQKVVFVGSTLTGNIPLKNVLSSFQNMLPYEAVFLDKGSHAGAIGAMLGT